VLASPRVARVLVVEFLTPVIGWLQSGRLPLSAALAAEPRLAVTQGDVYARLTGPPDPHWDVILIDVDHSPEEPLGAESDGFYRREGLLRARRHLAPGGLLGVWSYTESPRFAEALAQTFREVWVEPVRFENRVCNDVETNVLFFARG
jgi:spermidine synthase